MTVTREQFLAHVHQPLESGAQPSSPTKSTYRVRWRELVEWDDFVADAQAYWENLPHSQRTQVLPRVSPDYWDFVDVSLQDTTLEDEPSTVSQEPHLATPFTLLYSGPHNRAVIGATDNHARITTRLPANTVGQPDGCFAFNNQLAGIIELKSFWNLAETTILDVLQGLKPGPKLIMV